MTKVKIVDISGDRIVFESKTGVGAGIWRGTTPKLHHEYDIELDIEIDLTWGLNLTKGIDTKTWLEENTVFFSGRILSKDENTIVVFVDGPIILNVNNFPDGIENVMFFVPIDKILIYPVSL